MAAWDDGINPDVGNESANTALFALQGTSIDIGNESVSTALFALQGMALDVGNVSVVEIIIDEIPNIGNASFLSALFALQGMAPNVGNVSFIEDLSLFSYSTDDNLDELFKGIATEPGYATGKINFARERRFAYDWVNDQLRDRYSVPFLPIPAIVSLAEANYAVGLILRSKATTLGYELSVYNPFFIEAKSIIAKLKILQLGPDGSFIKRHITSTTSGARPTLKNSPKNMWKRKLDVYAPNTKGDFF